MDHLLYAPLTVCTIAANPLLSPLTPGFTIGRFFGVCEGLYCQYFPSRWGTVNFRNANPHLPPPCGSGALP